MRRDDESSAIMLPDFSRKSVTIFLDFLTTGNCESNLAANLHSEIIELLSLFQVNGDIGDLSKSSDDLSEKAATSTKDLQADSVLT